jgi:hypothetical protein
MHGAARTPDGSLQQLRTQIGNVHAYVADASKTAQVVEELRAQLAQVRRR